ncbi:HlyD family efflux transporter periplasmic adaptor subunit [Candidatus Contubernalis alkaliaceticus]|uniref:HlyD family efflux transporter periplasmic adaptor subunit n=1 Tax=Candidatus Contubernalis alkaliaceticus TaxID=338645 RepID=UPI001F4BD7A0|nr:HlyD family efflux transporter periplasmic adaptor subunit [Candidatus Contubernalis alkalaceticus]UNC92850.1 hypothetical protein HUE98_12530 [Candidatus Contubernalis alkalaceticus]
MRKKHLKLIPGNKKEKKERTPLQKFFRKTVVILSIILFVFFLGRSVFLWGYGMASSYVVKTVITEDSVLEEKIAVEGFIIREEKVVTSPQEGYLIWALEEGTRVGVGREVAEIVSRPLYTVEYREEESHVLQNDEHEQDKQEKENDEGDNEEDLLVDDNNLENDAAEVFEENEELFDPKEIEYHTSVVVNRLRSALSAGDMEEAEKYYHQLKGISQEQLIVHSSLHPTNSKLLSPFSGIVVYYTDGLEDFFQPSLIHFLSSHQLGAFKREGKEINFGEKIGRGSPIFKIVDNYTWYFTVPVTPEQGEEFKDNKRVYIRFDFVSDYDVRVDVFHIEEEQDKTLVTFKVNEQLENFYLYRQTQAEIIYNYLRGIIVPEEALLTKGEETGVYTIEKAMVRFRPVTVKEEHEGDVIVEGLPAGRVVITNPRFFREGQYIPS